jgi:peptidyl-tRNA hydrolase
LGSKEFWRIRIGVDNRHQEVLDSNNQNKITPLNPLFRKEGEQERKISGSDYVLMKLKEEEKRVLDGVIEDVCRELMERLR